MSDSYTKLFSSITESTIWCEPAGTRLVWITMLAKCNRHGEVHGSVPGLARLSNVSLEECIQALQTLSSPDEWSRTKENEGRRIEDIDGGWRLLNHAKFDKMKSEAEAAEREKERKREWDRQHRPSGHARQSDKSPTQSDDNPTKSEPPPAPTPTISLKAESKALVRQAGRFAEFWALYPNKTGKKPCQAKWLKRGLDTLADQIIADVRLRKAEDRRWLEGFVPNPETYLNQDRWDDEIQRRQPVRAGPSGTPGKQMQGIMALEGLKSGNRLDAGRDRDGAAEALPALVGPNTGR